MYLGNISLANTPDSRYQQNHWSHSISRGWCRPAISISLSLSVKKRASSNQDGKRAGGGGAKLKRGSLKHKGNKKSSKKRHESTKMTRRDGSSCWPGPKRDRVKEAQGGPLTNSRSKKQCNDMTSYITPPAT